MKNKDKILKHLETGSTITPLEANRKYKVRNLSAVISLLKKSGHSIDNRITYHSRKKYSIYKMKGQSNVLGM